MVHLGQERAKGSQLAGRPTVHHTPIPRSPGQQPAMRDSPPLSQTRPHKCGCAKAQGPRWTSLTGVRGLPGGICCHERAMSPSANIESSWTSSSECVRRKLRQMAWSRGPLLAVKGARRWKGRRLAHCHPGLCTYSCCALRGAGARVSSRQPRPQPRGALNPGPKG